MKKVKKQDPDSSKATAHSLYWSIGITEVVDDCWGAGESVEDLPFRLRADAFQHINEMMVETGKRGPVLQSNVHPVPDALQWSLLVARKQSGVGQQTTGGHHSYKQWVTKQQQLNTDKCYG